MSARKSFEPRLKRRVVFPRAKDRSGRSSRSSMAGDNTDEDMASATRLVELSDSDGESSSQINIAAARGGKEGEGTAPAVKPAGPQVPDLYTRLPFLHDDLSTETSQLQDQTVEECLPYLRGKYGDLSRHGIPHLQRRKHIRFLRQTLETLPEHFVALDASRPWIVYWATAGLSMLGENPSASYRTRLADTFRACQHPAGGFGGGHGQHSHLACSYAAVLSLVAAGGPEALDVIDRRAMWRWLGRMKQADGGFTMCAGGEQDVRGAFCAVVIASLLRLPLALPADDATRTGRRSLDDGLAAWVARCQSPLEGGVAAAPGREAHGAYAFCALGCLCILGPPAETITRHMDVPALYGWLAHRQYSPEGGFAGRTNKLVDGCYSHWVGGCWALLEAALGRDELWDREGLLRYVLCCAQGEKGGLRDKPSKHVDGYHTCYNLAGLSWAQYRHLWSGDEAAAGEQGADSDPLGAAFGWRPAQALGGLPVDAEDRVVPMHPIYIIPTDKALEARDYFAAKAGF